MPLSVERDAGVAILRMAHGPVNALDTELCVELAETFEALLRDPRVRAVVLTGNGRAFSAGVDLKRILSGGDEYTREFLPALTRCFLAVFGVDKPTVAAVDGHAVAGGCVIACACDHAVAADGPVRIGLTELAVGAPFPTAALEIVRARVHRRLREVLLHGATYAPRQARELGLVDELVEAGALAEHAATVAGRLAQVPQGTYALTKRQLQRPALAAIRRRSAEWEPQVLELWRSPEVRDAMRRFVAERLGC
ncbi:MAG TPA: enoyl-CoA hydratase/isomerase family protein [Actinomycetes bacterium]|nr:enoyl-CoA hydratase/isomerase family protein [Actinomycetes bacterium]